MERIVVDADTGTSDRSRFHERHRADDVGVQPDHDVVAPFPDAVMAPFGDQIVPSAIR